MLKATITINLEGAAFFDADDRHDPGPEVARILRALAKRVDGDGETAGTLRDANGNHVGDFDIDVHDPDTK